MKDKVRNVRSSDPFERLIQEKGLKIKDVLVNKEMNSIVVMLSNGIVFRSTLSDHPQLAKASQKKLNNWRAIAKGVGIHWPEIDEDLSLKGLMTKVALEQFTSSQGNLKIAI